MRTTCIDCGKHKPGLEATGSFQCEGCQEKLFNRLRNGVVDEMGKSGLEIVKELMEQGLKPKEIHEKSGIPMSSVYTYRSQVNKNKVEEPRSIKEVGKVKELEQKHDDAIEELKKFKEDYAQLTRNFTELQNSYFEMESKLEDSQMTTVCGCDGMSDELKQEQLKHAKLFEYMMTVAGVSK